VSTEYQAYLLRLQRSRGSDSWRATLQNADTGELLRFANEREMVRYLLQALAIAPDDPERPAAGEPEEGDDLI
jgi:hypothetical protein